MYCANCGKENKDDVKFCSSCGKEIGNNQTSTASANSENVNKNTELYGLDKPLSLWNVNKVKNPENYGGFNSGTFKLLSILSLGWLVGLILFFVHKKSPSAVKKTQAKNFLLCAAIGFVFFVLYISTIEQQPETYTIEYTIE